MRLGEKQVLTVVKKVEFGVYLGSENERVLLPKKQVPEGVEPGDPVEVFLYKDSQDRMIATTHEPKIHMGELAVLKVIGTGKIGAFLDWGLEKDLFLPFKEQTARIQTGDECLVALYVDKSERLCATMRVHDRLQTDSGYQKDDMVEGIVYGMSREYGVFVAVDNRYFARIPKKEVYGHFEIGQRVRARVTGVKEDGKLDLSVREKIPMQMDKDAEFVYEKICKNGGELMLNDSSDPEEIRQKLGMSKNAFKRAVGRLLREKKIEIREKSIAIAKK